MKEICIGIYGASGYAGQELVRLLIDHPHAKIAFATSSTYAGQFVPGTDLRYIPPDDASLDGIDVVFLALPHRASAPMAKKAIAAGVKVLDLSADLRLKDAETYETWYGVEHPHPELLPVPYGLPEMNRAEIKGAEVVAIPGCYPTTTLLGLYPLLQMNAIAKHTPIIVDAKTGVSGAGSKPSATTHFVEVYGNVSPYKTGRTHRHVGEIEQQMSEYVDLPGELIFTPHLLPIDRGLMASIYVTLDGILTADKAHSLYTNIYMDEPIVDVLPLGENATIKHAANTNRCVISLTPVGEYYLHITSVTDNLLKGTSSQALQCFNLMFDFPETLAVL